MNRLIYFWFHTRLWILPVGILWLALLAIQFDAGFIRFETVDAGYYKELAEDFVLGKSMVLDGLRNEKGNAFSPYPPGYPVLLGLFQFLGGSPDWPVHIVLHGILALILVLFWQEHLSLMPLGFLLFTDTALTLGASGISEFSFLIFCVLGVFGLSRLELNNHPKWQILLLISLSAALWIRYAAVFMLPFLVYKWFLARKLNPLKANVLVLPLLYTLLFAGILFGSQMADSGLPTGGDRYPNQDSVFFLTGNLLTGLLDQVCFFRNFSGSSVWSFLSGLVLSAFFLFFVIRPPVQVEGPAPSWNDERHGNFVFIFSRNLMIAGLFYLAFIIPLRWHYYFAEGFDARLLGPGACLLLLGLAVSKEEVLFRQPFFIKIGFLILAALFFLPTREILIPA
jgi:hypothetical protein